ncbi:hypothetical protein K474DRAFT_1455291 [Panus rudis PR-1116 ss-1]|nr:hypothetical protein K474DRAFT_1455291 [Panus rudis PR-1116 ss-1]
MSNGQHMFPTPRQSQLACMIFYLLLITPTIISPVDLRTRRRYPIQQHSHCYLPKEHGHSVVLAVILAKGDLALSENTCNRSYIDGTYAVEKEYETFFEDITNIHQDTNLTSKVSVKEDDLQRSVLRYRLQDLLDRIDAFASSLPSFGDLKDDIFLHRKVEVNSTLVKQVVAELNALQRIIKELASSTRALISSSEPIQ